MNFRLTNAKIIGTELIEEKDLLIKNGQIEALIDRDDVTEDYEAVDCGGRYVSAGFIDIHQHGGGGSDYMDGESDTFVNAANAHLAHGTTSIMPTLLSASKEGLLKAVSGYEKAKADVRIKNNLIGLHVEGPYISSEQSGAQKPENIRIFDEREYAEITEAANGNIRRWSVAPEVEGAEKFARFAEKNKIALSIAHSNADYDTVVRAFDWGYRHVTHLYSCTSTITRRKGFRVAGVLEAAYLIDGMNVEIIADGCHLPHTLLSYVAKFKKCENIALITDSMRAAGQDVSESYLGSADDPLPVIIEDGVAKLCDRSAFGGSIATADRLVRNMLMSGVSLCDAIKMITENPLRMMGLDSELKKGKIEAGYDADLCVFDENINVKTVFCGGNIVVKN